MGNYIDLTGKRFGNLTVLRKTYKAIKNGKRYVCWECQCDCGNITTVYTNALKSGNTLSCGCYNRKRAFKHGGKGTRLYNIWLAMKARCKNPNRPEYKHYGGRGISVCPDWENFANFQEWAITNGYQDHLTLDRIDVNGNYYPKNCRWATYEEQANNKRKTIKITVGDETHTISEWCKITNVPETAIRHRIHYGWEPQKIVYQPSMRAK